MSKEHLLKFKSRPFSWSSISQWEYNKEQWAKKYLEGIQEPENKLMAFGKFIGEKIASDPTFLPEVERYKHFEKELRSRIGDIELVGFLDSFHPDGHFLEYKTSSNKTRWNQKSAEDHGQISFYYLMLWLCYGISPEKIKAKLFYIPVEESPDFQMKLSDAPIQSFEVKKSIVDVLRFGNEIKKTYKLMCKYAKAYKGVEH